MNHDIFLNHIVAVNNQLLVAKTNFYYYYYFISIEFGIIKKYERIMHMKIYCR